MRFGIQFRVSGLGFQSLPITKWLMCNTFCICKQ